MTGLWQLCLISLRCAATGLCAMCVGIRREHVPFPRELRRTAGRHMCVRVPYSIRATVILPRAKCHVCFTLIKQPFLAKLSASYALTPSWLSSATFPFLKASSFCVRSEFPKTEVRVSILAVVDIVSLSAEIIIFASSKYPKESHHPHSG